MNDKSWKREGTTVYALTSMGFNAWWANVSSARRPEEGEASEAECERIAMLMKASPKLLEACKELLDIVSNNLPGYEAAIELGEAAVREAEGDE